MKLPGMPINPVLVKGEGDEPKRYDILATMALEPLEDLDNQKMLVVEAEKVEEVKVEEVKVEEVKKTKKGVKKAEEVKVEEVKVEEVKKTKKGVKKVEEVKKIEEVKVEEEKTYEKGVVIKLNGVEVHVAPKHIARVKDNVISISYQRI